MATTNHLRRLTRDVATSQNFEVLDGHVHSDQKTTLPAICVVTGATDDIVMISRRLTLQTPLQIWGAAVFSPFNASLNWLTNLICGFVLPGDSGLPLWLMVCFAQRFLLPLWGQKCDVTYWMDRRKYRQRRMIGFVASVAALGTLMFGPVVGRTEAAAGAYSTLTGVESIDPIHYGVEVLLATGILSASLLAIADRAFTGPVRLRTVSRRTGYKLSGFSSAFVSQFQRSNTTSATETDS